MITHLHGTYQVDVFDLNCIFYVWPRLSFSLLHVFIGLLENGYHDSNPYHNSVHAADVTQAMHCFIEEERIGPHLTPMEKMCAILAAVCHDVDHPGVNQNFLIATCSHLASLYNVSQVVRSRLICMTDGWMDEDYLCRPSPQ